MLGALIGTALLAQVASCVNITFFDASGCSGHRVYGGVIDASLPCYDLSNYDTANSTSLEHLSAAQTVHFYSDSACTDETYSSSSEVCHVHRMTSVGSFMVSQPQSDDRIANSRTAMTTDVVEYKMTEGNGESFVEPVSRIPLSTFFVAYYGLEATIGALSLSSLALGAYSARTGNPVGISGAILGFLATILAYFTSPLQNRLGVRTRNRIAGSDGTVTNIEMKRDLMSSVNDEYMGAMMNTTEGSVHIGHTFHDLGDGEQSSPVYEFTGVNGDRLHMSAFWHEKACSFVHRMFPKHTASLPKRQGPGYGNVRYDSGGFEFQGCDYNSAAGTSIFDGLSNDQLYRKLYQDLECLFAVDEIQDFAGMYFKYYNQDSVAVSGIKIKAYDGVNGGLDNIDCGYPTYQSQSCIN